MKAQINIASHSHVQHKALNKFTYAGIGVLIVTLGAAIVLFGYGIMLDAQSAFLDATREKYLDAMNQISTEKGKVLVLENRLGSIQSIIKGRSNLNGTLQDILGLLPDSIGIQDISTEVDHITITISSPNLADFDSLFQTGFSTYVASSKSKFKMVTLDSFGVHDGDTAYTAVLDLK